MSQTDITRMSSDYADNELELFKKTVSSVFKKTYQDTGVFFKVCCYVTGYQVILLSLVQCSHFISDGV